MLEVLFVKAFMALYLFPIFATGQGIDIKVPIPIIDDILKGNDDSDVRLWFRGLLVLCS